MRFRATPTLFLALLMGSSFLFARIASSAEIRVREKILAYTVTIDSIDRKFLAEGSGDTATISFTITPSKFHPQEVVLHADGASWDIEDITEGGSYTVDLNEGIDLTEAKQYEIKISADNSESATNHVTVLAIQISGPALAIDGTNSTAFSVSVQPSVTIASFQWIWTIDSGAVGNNPSVTFATPSQANTAINNAHWYARPNSRLAQDTGGSCDYKINSEITISGEGAALKSSSPRIWTVYIPNTAAVTSWPTIAGMPTISHRQVAGADEWYVENIGSLTRTSPQVTSYIPASSQFFNKIVTVHEGRHVEQFASISPWKDFFDATELYTTVLANMTSSVSAAKLEQQIQAQILSRVAADNAQTSRTRTDAERDAHNQSNTAPPDYLEQDIP